MVWVYKMAKYQIADHLKENDNQVKSIQHLVDNLQDSKLVDSFFEVYGERFHLTNKRAFKGPSEGLRSQEQEQEQEQEKENTCPDETPQKPSNRKSQPKLLDQELETILQELRRLYPKDQYDNSSTPHTSSQEARDRFTASLFKEKIRPDVLATACMAYAESMLASRRYMSGLGVVLGKKRLYADFVEEAKSRLGVDHAESA